MTQQERDGCPAPRPAEPIAETSVAAGAAYAANRANWDDRARVHAASGDYDTAGMVADPSRVSSVVRAMA